MLSGNRGNDLLVGGLGSDTFWMGVPDGADTVADFDFAAGDRIGIAQGVTWTTADVAGVAVVTFSNGASVTLTGNSADRSEEHTSELQSLMRISYAVFCLKKKKYKTHKKETLHLPKTAIDDSTLT